MPISERDQQEILINSKIRELDEQYPSLSFIPNIGQEKAFKFHTDYDQSPHISLFGGGNGVGKTAAMSIFAVGLIFGHDYLHDFFGQYKVFTQFKEHCIRRQRRGVIRLVVQADSMKEGGSVYQAITDWFPRGDDPKKPLYKMKKGGKTYYSEIEIHIPNAPIVEIKTHDQDVGAHAGTTVDWILCDEPFPQGLWTEMVGRTRDGGKIAMFLTPLNMAGWLMDDVVDQVDNVTICMTNASIWENCVDIPGTRGHLKRENIDLMIKAWNQSDPESVEARVEGKFTHLSGALYKAFDTGVHVCKPFEIPDNWPIYHIIDPHDSKPTAAIWILQGPNNRHWIIKEWPKEDFTKLGNTRLTISHTVQAFREMEGDLCYQVVANIMDPNKGSFVYSNTKRTVQDEFRTEGRRYDLCKVDDLDVGHKAVQRLLYYDPNKPVEDGYNEPQLMVWDNCPNAINALQKYGFKKGYDPGASLTAKIDKKFKDFADLVRYYAVSYRDFQTVSDRRDFVRKIYTGRTKLKFK